MFSSFPIELVYIIELLVVIVVAFVYLRRPMYECMLFAFIIVVASTNSYGMVWVSLVEPASSPVFFTIVAFLVAAHLFARTGAIEAIVAIILPIVGRLKGGGGYVSLVVSTFMASLSGTGPGNVAATGVFTIPTMIKTGYPRALAATTEMSCSALGNIIPPSGIVLLSFGIYNSLYDANLSVSQMWLLAWGVGIWFFVQRWLTLIFFAHRYKLEPVNPEDIPDLRQAIKEGALYLLIPPVIFIPLIVDNFFGGFITARLGDEGGQMFSRYILLTTPALAGLFAVWAASRYGQVKKGWRPIIRMLSSSAVNVAPVAATIYLAYAIAVLFGNLGLDTATAQWLLDLGVSRVTLVLILPIFTMVLGMVIPGSSQIAIFGGVLMTTFAALGVSPLLVAAMLPAITGAMEGMTPPLALGMYVAMGIAESPFGQTARLALIWVAVHLILSFLLLLGYLPILGI